MSSTRPTPRGQRWYHSKWWMALGLLAVLIVVAFPFPWWW